MLKLWDTVTSLCYVDARQFATQEEERTMTDDIMDAVNAAMRRAERCETVEQRKEYLEEIDRCLTVARFRVEDAQEMMADAPGRKAWGHVPMITPHQFPDLD